MPEMTPVADQVRAPDPNQLLNTYSGILGLQQQKQALQTGAIAQQGMQAQTEQEQQKNRELQAIGNLVKTGASSNRYKRDDGSFDDQKMSDDIAQVAPVYGQGIRNQALSATSEMISNKQAAQNLNDTQRKSIGGVLQSLAADPNVTNSKVIDAMDGLLEQNKDPSFRRLVLSNLTHMPQNGKSSDLQQSLSTMAGGLNQASPISGTTNAAGKIVNRNTATGALTAAGGDPSLNPSSPTVAAATANATSRITGQAGTDIDRSRQVSSLISPSQNAIGLTQHIDDLADQIHSGKFSQFITRQAAAAGGKSPQIVAQELLDKDLGQVKSLASSSAGTDQRMQQVLSGYPEATSQNDTIHTAMDYIRGTFRQNVARGKLLNSYQEKHPDLQGYQHADDALTGNTDPLMHELSALKTPQEKSAFYSRNFKSAAEAQAFKNKTMGMTHVVNGD